MGKVGEKQKRTPKVKDKKQSERSKEAALELGAEQETADALRLLDQTIGRRHSEPTGEATTLLAVNSGGIAKLADGTFWRLALDGIKAYSWIGARVIVTDGKNRNPAWRLSLVNLENNDFVAVIPAGTTF
jgi:hypothetical protein